MNVAWAGGGTLAAKIDRLTLEAAETLALQARWCDQGHVKQATDATCPVCRAATAELLSDVLERLHLGLIDALEVGTVYPMTWDEQVTEALGGRR